MSTSLTKEELLERLEKRRELFKLAFIHDIMRGGSIPLSVVINDDMESGRLTENSLNTLAEIIVGSLMKAIDLAYLEEV